MARFSPFQAFTSAQSDIMPALPNSSTSIDYLIVGAGIAACTLGYRLEKAGKKVVYFHDSSVSSASAVAAGIINPITGRRYVKSWRIDELLPAADELYPLMEQELGARFYFRLPLVRSIANRGESNSWLARTGLPAYKAYMDDKPKLGHIPDLVNPAFAYGGILQAGRTDLHTLCKAWQNRALNRNRLKDDHFDYEELNISDSGVSYSGIHANRIVFCEGWRARYNPWFSYLPHRGAKGEVFLAQIDGPPLKRLFKNRIFLVPRQSGDYWIGATTQNQFEHDRPTRSGKEWLEREVKTLIKLPVSVEHHQAAIRPTVKDRRPLLGPHPEHRNLFIFNGLGTKGASLAPLMSKWLMDHLENGIDIPKEVAINRFGK
ncbi:MAG: FAD-dependent oxidoreductase [Bacteroidota bacterium]